MREVWLADTAWALAIFKLTHYPLPAWLDFAAFGWVLYWHYASRPARGGAAGRIQKQY
jgi:hypothetical protein